MATTRALQHNGGDGQALFYFKEHSTNRPKVALFFVAMSVSQKKESGEGKVFYTVPGLAKKLGRNKTAIYAALRRLGVEPTVKVDGKPRLFTDKDVKQLGKSLRRPNATPAAQP
jgi:hypothetical protein